MNRLYKKYLILALGWGFLLLGVVGLFLPILQGLLFIAIGLVILSYEYSWAKSILSKATARFPWFSSHVDKAHTRVQSWRDSDSQRPNDGKR